MSKRDYTKLAAFDFFNGDRDDRDDRDKEEHRPILDVTYNGEVDEIRDYLPRRDGTSKIIQLWVEKDEYVYQKLTGSWDNQMKKVALDLRLEHEKTGLERIIDKNVTSKYNFFGPDGSWQIKSWEVVARKHPTIPDKGRLIDTIEWIKVVSGKTVRSTSSTHEWRIY